MGDERYGANPRIQERKDGVRWVILSPADEFQCILAVGLFALFPLGFFAAKPFSFLALLFGCATCWSMALWLAKSTFPALRSAVHLDATRIGLEVRGKLRFEIEPSRVSTVRIANRRLSLEDENDQRLGEIPLNPNAKHEDLIDVIRALLPEDVSWLKLNPNYVRGTRLGWITASCFCLLAGPILIFQAYQWIGEASWVLLLGFLGMILVGVGLVALPIGLTFQIRNTAPTWRPMPDHGPLRAMYRFRMGIPNRPRTFRGSPDIVSTVAKAKLEARVTNWILGALFIGVPIAISIQQQSLIGLGVGLFFGLLLAWFHRAMQREIALIERVEQTLGYSIHVSGQAMSVSRTGEESPVLEVTWPILRIMNLTAGSNRYSRIPVLVRTAEGDFLFDIALYE